MDREKFAYRWVNEDKLLSRTESDDWEKVPTGDVASTDLGSSVSRLVGQHKDGSPQRAILCRKPKGYYDDDRAAGQARVDDTMTAIKGGKVGNSDSAGSTYIPSEGINISRK
jgi:hypothetical protein